MESVQASAKVAGERRPAESGYRREFGRLVLDNQEEVTRLSGRCTRGGFRNALRTGRNRKGEGGARPVIRLRPQAALMPLDYRAAHRQADAHAPTLRRVK